MKLITQPNNVLCGPASLAMVLDRTIPEILSLVGHNGEEVVYPHIPHPRCCRGFTIQEFQDVADHLGYMLIEILACPLYWAGEGTEMRQQESFPFGRDADSRILHYMDRYPKGLILGRYAVDRPHMVAFENGVIYDPSGRVYDLLKVDDGITIEAYFPVLESNLARTK